MLVLLLFPRKTYLNHYLHFCLDLVWTNLQSLIVDSNFIELPNAKFDYEMIEMKQ